jgi:hypothetical protein
MSPSQLCADIVLEFAFSVRGDVASVLSVVNDTLTAPCLPATTAAARLKLFQVTRNSIGREFGRARFPPSILGYGYVSCGEIGACVKFRSW